MRGIFKAHLFPLLILFPLVIILQYIILKPHLRYAFADVDWVFLLSFKQLSAQHYNPMSHLINAWEVWGVYTYQVYYIGLIEHFFGFVYRNFQIVTLVFKVIATMSIYPVIILVTKNRLAAFLTTLIYAVSYSSVGVMYTVVTSGLFVAIPVMNLFFFWYFYLIQKGKNKIWEILIGVFLFSVTLLLATERMYPLIPTVILFEFFWWFKNKYSRAILFQGLKRLSGFLTLFLVGFLFNPSIFIPVSGNAIVTYQKFMLGNWQVILSPVISLGSLFVPKDYWPIFGVPNISGIFAYTGFLLSGPMIMFAFLSIFLGLFISRYKIRFILDTLIFTGIFGLGVYFLSTHQVHIPDSTRMHFDYGYITPALIGSYVISFTIALFKEWLRGGKKNNLLINMVGGIAVACVFIIMTWIPADYVLVFFGVHRYLTIPAIGSSLLIAGLMTFIFNKLWITNLRPFAFTVFLFLIPLIFLNSKIISDHMKYELEFTGTDAVGHIRMKEKLWSYLGNFSESKPSIFYFDESIDYDNGYFDETTIMAGFNYWMRFRGRDIVNAKLMPALLRSNLICPEPRNMCLSKIKELVTEKGGVKGIKYGDIFYESENFYAFRFVNKDIVDIKPEVVKIIGLE